MRYKINYGKQAELKVKGCENGMKMIDTNFKSGCTRVPFFEPVRSFRRVQMPFPHPGGTPQPISPISFQLKEFVILWIMLTFSVAFVFCMHPCKDIKE